MKMKLLLAGVCLGSIGTVLYIVRIAAGDSFPDWLRAVMLVCLAIGSISSLTFLYDMRKRDKGED